MPKTKLTLLLLAALLLGACLGFYINDAIIRARIRSYSQIPENMPQHITGLLTKRLDLTPEQQQQVLAVLNSYRDCMAQAREQTRNLFTSLLQEITAEVDQHLTPEQVAEHKKMLDELQKRRQDNHALRRAYRSAESDNQSRK